MQNWCLLHTKNDAMELAQKESVKNIEEVKTQLINVETRMAKLENAVSIINNDHKQVEEHSKRLGQKRKLTTT